MEPSLAQGGAEGSPWGDLGRGWLGSSPKGGVHLTVALDRTGSLRCRDRALPAGSLEGCVPGRSPGSLGGHLLQLCWARWFCALRTGVPGPARTRGGSLALCSEAKVGFTSPLASEHSHDLSDLISWERTYLVNVVSDLHQPLLNFFQVFPLPLKLNDLRCQH